MTYSYPSTSDYKEIVQEFVKRDKMQEFLRDNNHFIVHANETEDLAEISKRILFGYPETDELRDYAFKSDTERRSTAFSLRSHADNNDLADDLKSAQSDETVFNQRKNLIVDDVTEEDGEIEVDLTYQDKRVGRREFIAKDDKEATVRIEEPDEDGVRTVKQNYDKIDEFNAVSDFVEGWKANRQEDDSKKNIDKFDISLLRLSIEERIELFDNILYNDPGNWLLEDVREMGIKQGDEMEAVFGEDIEDEEELQEAIDDNLEGITDAVVSGEGLRDNGFVKKCEENGYYFNSAVLLLDNTDVGRKVEIHIEFKEGSHNNVDIVLNQGYQKTDDKTTKTSFDPEIEESIREEFREMVVEEYNKTVKKSEGVAFEEPGPKELGEISGIGSSTVEKLEDAGIEDFDDVAEASLEELKVENVGDELAERLKAAAE